MVTTMDRVTETVDTEHQRKSALVKTFEVRLFTLSPDGIAGHRRVWFRQSEPEAIVFEVTVHEIPKKERWRVDGIAAPSRIGPLGRGEIPMLQGALLAEIAVELTRQCEYPIKADQIELSKPTVLESVAMEIPTWMKGRPRKAPATG